MIVINANSLLQTSVAWRAPIALGMAASASAFGGFLVLTQEDTAGMRFVGWQELAFGFRFAEVTAVKWEVRIYPTSVAGSNAKNEFYLMAMPQILSATATSDLAEAGTGWFSDNGYLALAAAGTACTNTNDMCNNIKLQPMVRHCSVSTINGLAEKAPKVMSLYVSTRRMIPHAEGREFDYHVSFSGAIGSVVAAEPAKVWYMALMHVAPHQTDLTTAGSWTIESRITKYVRFYGRKPVSS